MDNLNSRGQSEDPKRNAEGPGAFQEMENPISMLKLNEDAPAAPEFRDRLKSRVLEAHAKNNMPRRLPPFRTLLAAFKTPRYSVAISVFLLIAVVGGLVLNGFLFGG